MKRDLEAAGGAPRTFAAVLMAMALLAVAVPVRAQVIFLRPALGTGVTADQIRAVETVTRDATAGMDGAQLVNEEAAAKIVLQPEITRLDRSFIFSIESLKAGKTVQRQSARAQSFDEVDEVAKRLVRAMLKQVSVERDARVSDVLVSEVNSGQRRVENLRYMYIGFGPAIPVRFNTENYGVHVRPGYGWALNDRFQLNFGADLAWFRDSEAMHLGLALGGEQHFDNHNNSLFLRASMGYGLARVAARGLAAGAEGSRSGFSGSFGIGYKVFRISEINLSFGLDYQTYFVTLPSGQPHAVTFTVTTYFQRP